MRQTRRLLGVVLAGACLLTGGCTRLGMRGPRYAGLYERQVNASADLVRDAVELVIGNMALEVTTKSTTNVDGLLEARSGLGQRVKITYEAVGDGATMLRVYKARGPHEDWLPKLVIDRIEATVRKDQKAAADPDAVFGRR